MGEPKEEERGSKAAKASEDRASLHRSQPQQPRNLLAARHLKLPPRTASPLARPMAQQQGLSPQARQPPPRPPQHPPKQERLEEKLQVKRMLLVQMIRPPSPSP